MFSCKQSVIHPWMMYFRWEIRHERQQFRRHRHVSKKNPTKLLLRSIASLSFCSHPKALENTQKNHSPKFCFHIINPCTQFADQVLFRRALYASSRGSVSHACPPRPLLPPPTGRHPRMSPSLLNLTGVTLLDQILCCSHIWGCWAFPQRFGPRETQPRKQKHVQVWEVLKIEPSPGQ